MRPTAFARLLLLSALSFAACKSTGSRVATVDIEPLAQGEQIWRTITGVENIRHVMLAVKPHEVIDPDLQKLLVNFDPNAILYCDGKCEAPAKGSETGKQGISTGPFMESSRASVHGPNWIQFKFTGDGTYVSKNSGGYTKDKASAGTSSFEYRVVFTSPTEADLYTASTDASGAHTASTTTDLHMTYMGNDVWHRFNKNSPNDVNQQYNLRVVYRADGSETQWTQKLFDDNKISNIHEFKIPVPATSDLASGDLPTGPARGDIIDDADAKKISDVDAKRAKDASGKDVKSDTGLKKNGVR